MLHAACAAARELQAMAALWNRAGHYIYSAKKLLPKIFLDSLRRRRLFNIFASSPSIGNTLWRVSTMFTRSAITPPEVNGFG